MRVPVNTNDTRTGSYHHPNKTQGSYHAMTPRVLRVLHSSKDYIQPPHAYTSHSRDASTRIIELHQLHLKPHDLLASALNEYRTFQMINPKPSAVFSYGNLNFLYDYVPLSKTCFLCIFVAL